MQVAVALSIMVDDFGELQQAYWVGFAVPVAGRNQTRDVTHHYFVRNTSAGASYLL